MEASGFSRVSDVPINAETSFDTESCNKR